ncbi:hypothetical protein COCMIDRAFT_24607 [Bipolaris oryzae ATCC 44560]|uniref:DNA-directed DNA polymerase n=1 Tax=Bipolaris oryzae ATCC 44560 TaxID=930090 RepID=W6ZUI6_COCMI|nr:uncharacterized protein COCMIDRAFT_24607 [Bipolaris oryzae ATCC 44560]EUC47441.1 hypothetical protein COCMIDRAFT_24607 [Bipolaris oryzae ATCC 44560]
MSDLELLAKITYFEEQALLNSSDDGPYTANESVLNLERALEESKPILVPLLLSHSGSFNGPTPREIQAQFEEHTERRRTSNRQINQKLTRSSTVPPTEPAESIQISKSRNGRNVGTNSGKSRLKRTISLSQIFDKESIPFYKRAGAIPRELKSGKTVKPANDIRLFSESKQLLKEKIIYFYPNDDISMARRRRIHKVIQLGAAWADKWSDSITHVMFDDGTYTYTQLVQHLGRSIPPVRELQAGNTCINRGELLDPTVSYFVAKGAQGVGGLDQTPGFSNISNTSQGSLKIKSPKRKKATQETQKTDSHPTEESVPSTHPYTDAAPSSPLGETVEDSFIMSSPGAAIVHGTMGRDQFGDALFQAIQEAKSLAYLPIDEDEEGDQLNSRGVDTMEDSKTDQELLPMDTDYLKRLSVLSKASALRDKKLFNMNSFQCMDPSASSHISWNPNARTIQILEEMCKYYDSMQDQWRSLSYRKCVATLKKQTVKITTAEQAAKLPSIGTRLAAKIEEIVLTDRLRRLESTRHNPQDVALRLFLGIYGVGLVHANKWIQAGYRTLEDLKTKATLSENQKIGLEHYHDFNSRIPRAEVEAHGATVAAALKEIDPEFSATIMGSYRRGAQDSGDIDIMLSRPNMSPTAMSTTVFEVLIPHLFKTGFLKASLIASRYSDSSSLKWHGASCIPSSTVWRRIDFLVVPEQETGAALLYFTGDDVFNRSMRLLARKKGMKLNQRGLYTDVLRGRKGEKLNDGVLIEGRSERRIFEILGVPWKEPSERIC